MKHLVCVFLFSSISLKAQMATEQEPVIADFQSHYDLGKQYVEELRYASAIIELNKAIAIAKEAGETREYLQASIDLAETFRRTRDFQSGLEILLTLGEHPEYPLQEVRKLGRIAAIHHEETYETPKMQYDSVTKYLNPALQLAIENNYPIEQASLKNELGFLLSRHKSWELGLPYFLEAAELYYSHNDMHNYVAVNTHVITTLYSFTRETARIDSLIKESLKVVEGKNWHSAKFELYKAIAFFNLYHKNDSLAYHKWRHSAVNEILANLQVIHNSEMDNLRVSYETSKFQNEAASNAEELAAQRARNQQMIVYLSILALLMFAVGFLFLRERENKKAMNQINQQLKVANEKYQMLMVESNHRIKNNLQMVISMLEYTSKDVNPENTLALKRMSGKIHTVSALHKHLYVDVHNARVDLATYFREIIELYKELSSGTIQVNENFHEISIPSERLVYFGLIFNEMLTNTLEHNRASHKQVYISAAQQNGAFMYAYRDDSVYEGNAPRGTGSQLIMQLIRRVGGEQFSFNPDNGEYQFKFYA